MLTLQPAQLFRQASCQTALPPHPLLPMRSQIACDPDTSLSGASAVGVTFKRQGIWPSSALFRDTEFANLHQTSLTGKSGALVVIGAGANNLGGVVTIETSTFTNCTTQAAQGGGGAAAVIDGGNLTLLDTTFAGCHALQASGGALLVASEGFVFMVASSITECTSMRNGGGASVDGTGSTLLAHNSIFQGERTQMDLPARAVDAHCITPHT